MHQLLAGAAALFAVTAAFAQGAASPLQSAPAGFPSGQGQRQVAAACTNCHATTVVTGKRLSEQQWVTVVDRMIDHGAKVSDADYDIVVDYLARSFAPARN